MWFELVVAAELFLLLIGITFLYFRKQPFFVLKVAIPEIKIPQITIPPIKVSPISIPSITVPLELNLELNPSLNWPANGAMPEMVRLLKKDESGSWKTFAECRATHPNVQKAIETPGLAVERSGEILEGIQ